MENKEQQQAISSNSRTILCLAGAGAGKSHTLVQRIARLIKEGSDSNSILALTFTNNAAHEMKRRFQKSFPELKCPKFMTFHGFCYFLIAADSNIRAKLGYKSIPTIAKQSELKQISTEIKMKIDCKLSDEKLKDMSIKLSRADEMKRDLYHKLYEKSMIEKNLITFDILGTEVCNLFKLDDVCTHRWKARYKHILIDEFQDTDGTQFAMVSSFNRGTSFFLVGDSQQCIYQFRGTSNEFIKMLAKDDNWEVIKLVTNYRSTDKICDYANRFVSYADPAYRIKMEGIRSGGIVEDRVGYDLDKMSSTSIRCIRDIENKIKTLSGSSAILCRSNNEVKEYKAAFKERETSKEAYDLDELEASVISDDNLQGWIASSMNAEDYASYIRMCKLSGSKLDVNTLLSTFSIPDGHNKLRTVKSIREFVTKDITVKDKTKEVARIIGTKFDESLFNENLPIFENLKKMKSEDDSTLYIGTIHSAKGLEYDNVFVPGVNSYVFKLDTEEMKNLFYVAVTRARTNLFVYRR